MDSQMRYETDDDISIALLMAAGIGKRIRPLSFDTPKPLILVHGKPMIESLIDSIILAGIPKIIVTVGYKKEKYEYLTEKYDRIILLENHDYESTNTISSFHTAMDYLRGANCLICESDLYIADSSVIKRKITKSHYLIRNVAPQNHEWGFELCGERIVKVVRPRKTVFLDHHMYGVAYWMRDDLDELIASVRRSYKNKSCAQLAYDEIANEIFDQIQMGVVPVLEGQLFEIDTLSDLAEIDSSYKNLLE